MRTWKFLAAALVAAALVALPTAPAAAHSGKLKLTVAGDGAGGVTVQATHADGHRLDQPVRLTLTATGAGGRTAGPVQLEPAGEGQGFYASGPLLSPGRWRVTVSAPDPYRATASATVQARAAQSPPPPPSARPVAVQAGPAGRTEQPGAGWWPLAAGGLGVVALLAAVPLVLVRRRRSAP
ncbi:hypothetical protein C5N14_02190 [Micromonospora sp. MW-13]|uniref:hypothetical protein n=1 Tax=Micromonospora sp. MW-13 TaxID=2094022 RepID=UPI000E442FA7|nr:hypothetical protein [Micromonospora sp. MW-13]RGC70659.1 hypothetical protein C5N14_02190 [Micromonospora sp. MW-13]